jgi:hypothetical protein
MKYLIFCLFITTQALATQFSLPGSWNTGANWVEFIEVDGIVYTQTTERFVYPDGELSHTIQQSMKIQKSGAAVQTGTVDIFDSRGCSYADLPVKLQFRTKDVVSFLITSPRYKIVTITTGPTSGYYRPVYCDSPYPRGNPYICGREYVRPNQRRECRLVEYVQTPITLRR